jgi:flavodoxin
MRILVAYYSETGNTARVAQAIHEEASAQGHEAHLKPVGNIAVGALSAYDLVFLGSACHDADLARPVKEFLEGIPMSPAFKLAGFVTHASYAPEGGDREQQAHETWASRCVLSFREAGQAKGLQFLGYFGCQGAPSPPIEQFIHGNIVTDEHGWDEYIRDARTHPDEDDLRRAREFAQEVLARF